MPHAVELRDAEMRGDIFTTKALRHSEALRASDASRNDR